jgi:hypothetical protein
MPRSGRRCGSAPAAYRASRIPPDAARLAYYEARKLNHLPHSLYDLQT